MNEDFTLRLAEQQDIDGIFNVMEQVKETMERPEWFVADDRNYIKRHIDGDKGFTVVAGTNDGSIAAFFTIDYPKNRADNLGYDIGLAGEERLRTAHMDTVGVLSEYRGNRLMARLLEFAERILAQTKYCHLMCTIHPDNRYSLDNMTGHGYQVMATKEKYGGFLRHILYKKLAGDSDQKPVVLVSACLLGVNCRYNGKGELNEAVRALMKRAVLIPVCPEIMGGLATPRDPAERTEDKVMTIAGGDVTSAYQKGAKETLELARLYGCRSAILKERSPSCGSGRIYDGSHKRTLTDGDGVTAELLKKNGILVFGESNTEDLERFYGI